MNGLNSVVLVALISQLGSPDYKTRERATAALAESMPAAFIELHVVEHSNDLEVARRATSILNGYYASTAAAKADMSVPIGCKDMPWIDNNTQGVAYDRAEFWLAQARLKIGMHGPPDWQDYRLATRMYITNLYASRGDSGKIAQLLNSLLTAERLWVMSYGRNFNPPIVNQNQIPPPRRVDDLPK